MGGSVTTRAEPCPHRLPLPSSWYSWLINSFVNGESPVSAPVFAVGHADRLPCGLVWREVPCPPCPVSPLLGLWGWLWASCSRGGVGVGSRCHCCGAPQPLAL